MEKESSVALDRVARLFDAGTFVEVGSYQKRTDGGLTGAVCGYGAIGGKLVCAFAQASDRRKGAFDALQAKKIAALYAIAVKNGAPIVGLFDSAGAVVGDGTSAMAAYGSLLKTVSDASGVVPQIAVITGVCTGMAATVASMFDFVVTVKDAGILSVSAPFLAGREVGTAEAVAENGLASLIAKDEAAAFALAQKLVALLPSNNEEGVNVEELNDDINRTVSVEGLSAKEQIAAIVDAGDFLELGASYGCDVVTGLCRFGGVVCGIVANNGGLLTADGADKASRFVSFLDSFSIPVVTLVDALGTETGKDAEKAPLASKLGKLAMSYATAETAKITVVAGHAYGAAFTLMGSKALGADIVYALPTSEISVMAPESAVAFLWNDKITADLTREDLVERWKKEVATPTAAAADGSIDDVIDPAELRQRICAAVYLLMMKNPGAPMKKHCNLPL